MSRNPFPWFHALTMGAVALHLGGCANLADHGVAVSSSAFTDYTQSKYAPQAIRRESYVFMQGNYFAGTTVDRSLETIRFRDVAEMLAPELAKRQFWPAKDLKSSDLVLVVHYGVTSPTEHVDKLLARDPPSLSGLNAPDANTGVNYLSPHTYNSTRDDEQPLVSDSAVADQYIGVTDAVAMDTGFRQAEERTDQFGNEYSQANAVKLLGYGRHLRKTQDRAIATASEITLRSDLETERYFVVVQAYDLRQMKDKKPRLVWTLHLNMSSAGNNFKEAVAMMSDVAVNYFGKDIDRVDTEMPHLRSGNVTIGDVVIVGEK